MQLASVIEKNKIQCLGKESLFTELPIKHKYRMCQSAEFLYFTASEAVLLTVRRLDVDLMKYRKKERRIEEKEGTKYL
jgi:hypothetical protein